MGFVLISYWVSSAWATTHRSGISSKKFFLWRALFLEEGNKRDVVEYKSNELKEREDYPLSTQVRREYDTHIEEEPNLRDYIDVILRRKWIVISCLAISVVNDTFAQILQANEKKSDPIEIEKRQLAREEGLLDSFLDRVKVTPDRKSRLVQISFESSFPELSAKVANTLVDEYIGWVLERKLDATKAARRFLEKQLGEVKAKLERAEEELSSYAKGADIVSLDEKFNLTYKQLTKLNYKTVHYRILEREVETNKSIYQNLLQRLKETEVASGFRATNIQVVDYASTPLIPYKPNIKLNMLLATLMGLMGGVFLAFIFEHFDSTIKDEEEVKRRFSLPFLGAIPLVDENELQDLEKVVYANPKSLVSEAFRVIR